MRGSDRSILRNVEATLEQIKLGQVKVADIPRITIVELEGEQGYVSLNNRRLWVLKQCKREPSPSTHSHSTATAHSMLHDRRLTSPPPSSPHCLRAPGLGLLPAGRIPCRIQSAAARSQRDRARLGGPSAAVGRFATEARFIAAPARAPTDPAAASAPPDPGSAAAASGV